MAFNFNVLKALSANTKLVEENKSLLADNQRLLEEIQAYKQKEAAYTLGAQDWASEKEALIKGHEEAMATLVETHNQAIKDLDKKVADASTSAGNKVAQAVAAIGIDPETIVKVSASEIVGSTKPKSRFRIEDMKNK